MWFQGQYGFVVQWSRGLFSKNDETVSGCCDWRKRFISRGSPFPRGNVAQAMQREIVRRSSSSVNCFLPAVKRLLADAEPATDLRDLLAAFDLVQGVDDFSLLRPLRGIVCVSLAGVAALCRKSQILRFQLSAVPTFGVWVTDLNRPLTQSEDTVATMLPRRALIRGNSRVWSGRRIRPQLGDSRDLVARSLTSSPT
jgi:hypothetical protein